MQGDTPMNLIQTLSLTALLLTFGTAQSAQAYIGFPIEPPAEMYYVSVDGNMTPLTGAQIVEMRDIEELKTIGMRIKATPLILNSISINVSAMWRVETLEQLEKMATYVKHQTAKMPPFEEGMSLNEVSQYATAVAVTNERIRLFVNELQAIRAALTVTETKTHTLSGGIDEDYELLPELPLQD
jgi:hypothetical protein